MGCRVCLLTVPGGSLRGRRGGGGGQWVPPTNIPQNDRHDALIILNTRKWGTNFSFFFYPSASGKNKQNWLLDLGAHFLNPPPQHPGAPEPPPSPTHQSKFLVAPPQRPTARLPRPTAPAISRGAPRAQHPIINPPPPPKTPGDELWPNAQSHYSPWQGAAVMPVTLWSGRWPHGGERRVYGKGLRRECREVACTPRYRWSTTASFSLLLGGIV